MSDQALTLKSGLHMRELDHYNFSLMKFLVLGLALIASGLASNAADDPEECTVVFDQRATKSFGDDPPLTASIKRDNGKILIIVENRSKNYVTVLKAPHGQGFKGVDKDGETINEGSYGTLSDPWSHDHVVLRPFGKQLPTSSAHVVHSLDTTSIERDPNIHATEYRFNLGGLFKGADHYVSFTVTARIHWKEEKASKKK